MIELLSKGKRQKRMRTERMVAMIREKGIILSLFVFINSKPSNDALVEKAATWSKILNVQHSTLNAQLSTSALYLLYGDKH